MDQKRARKGGPISNPRLDPQSRLCSKFDDMSIALFPVASQETMGVRVVDNCAEEHIM